MGWTREQIESLTGTIPEAPGVYLMRDAAGRVLYVGKAQNLHARVLSYFHRGDTRVFVSFLDKLLRRIEPIVTNNEKEALILENELIKKHRPPFNVLLRDDKNYLYLRIDLRHPFPRLELVRRRKNDGATYFGPYHTAGAVRATHALVSKHFGLRTCSDRELRARSRPCLEFQMGRCCGPCTEVVDQEAYGERVQAALLFLRGRHRDVLRLLKKRMLEASGKENFEEAARLRDQIRAIEASLKSQHVVLQGHRDVDAMAIARDAGKVAFVVLRFEGGVMRDRASFTMDDPGSPDDGLLEALTLQYYHRAPVPETIVVPPHACESPDALSQVLQAKTETRVRVVAPKSGALFAVVQMVVANAEQVLREALASRETLETALRRVAEVVGIDRLPHRIEGYDLSNLFGAEPVGAMVVFTDGKPDKAQYRRFTIREGANSDVDALAEVLRRRSARAGELPIPDLLLLDGGRAQLSTAVMTLRGTALADVPVVAIAKSRVANRGGAGPATRTPERLYLLQECLSEGEPAPELVIPKQSDPGLHLLMRIRDEAHSYVVRFHRRRRLKRGTVSVLDGVKGLGPKRRRLLLQHFGTMERLARASIEDLMSIKGLPRGVATAVYEAMHGRGDHGREV